MCTYITDIVPVAGSAKGPSGWFSLSQAVVFFDHPYHAALDHALTISFPAQSATVERVAVELSPASARALAASILATLDGAACLVSEGTGS